ncbi:MAG TPA: CRISPR-associated helicase Cas3' [Rectinema sp.]|jgi:CRISPR-associated endonuclease/helicase Cas3|nr:CRISPR-associated helicase Cas3' [Rectinema sp.]HQN03455.1 CRISPR-associated helicase Cas3' [Rectinema sp.]
MGTIHFWAKTTENGAPGISVYQHMINVGCVAQCIAEIQKDLLESFRLRASEVGALAALHDIGKISPGFQRKCMAWLKENNLLKIESEGNWQDEMEPDHGKISYVIIQSFLRSTGLSTKESAYLASAVASHHGKLIPPDDRPYQLRGRITEKRSGITWDEEQQKSAKAIWQQFNADSNHLKLDDNLTAYWYLAGLTSVADWIGSDERFFSAEYKSNNEAFDSHEVVRQALDSIGYVQPHIKEGLSFYDMFGFYPNPMQQKTMETITGPGIYVIEAPMGQGKTEAALAAAYQLMLKGLAQGIYFALPTQTTSNRIHLRIKDFIQKISPDAGPTRLIHANSWLLTDDILPQIREKSGRDWFASAKRALIAPFGVGTVDQALLGILAAKHFFVRQFALAGKVVIIDEVHSYDLYTGTLIDALIRELLSLQCTIIVLSATLTNKRRAQLLNSSDSTSPNIGVIMDKKPQPYPLISGRVKERLIDIQEIQSPPSRNVKIIWIAKEAAILKALELAQKGGAVLWICDTVESAQTTYLQLKDIVAPTTKYGLLHSRFPFYRREILEEEWMQRLGKEGVYRCGCILVATQIVEQSVDVDADLIITELAPTDMLLQRMGRLWRHERSTRPVTEPEFCLLQEEKSLTTFKELEARSIKNTLGGKAFIYAPYILMRSLNLWDSIKEITIPNDIRSLLESTYEELEEEPSAWKELCDEWFGSDSAKKMLAMMNANLWQIPLSDEEGVQTRVNEQPTIDVVLCAHTQPSRYMLIDGTEVALDNSEYSLSVARNLHKNIVKVPQYCFYEAYRPPPIFSKYLHGWAAVGIVSDDTTVQIDGLKEMYQLCYSNELGLKVNNNKKEENL